MITLLKIRACVLIVITEIPVLIHPAKEESGIVKITFKGL